MGNLLQYTDKSVTIDNKLKALLSQIQYDYNNGNIRTETEYYYRIKTMLSDFYQSLTQPTFTYRPAVSTPISSEYNAMITEAYNDMEYIIKDCEVLKNNIEQSFSDTEFSRNMMTYTLAYLEKKLNILGENLQNAHLNGYTVFTELFENSDSFGNMKDINACRIDTTNGTLTLKPTTYSSAQFSSLKIDERESNGLPGNTHCADILNQSIHYVGQEGLHNNPNDMIDSNLDSWFEYEIFEITDTVRQKCNSYGFEYDEGISWVTEDGVLKLKLTLTVNSPKPCSWISINPKLSDVKGAKMFRLDKCNIVSANNYTYTVGSTIVMNGTIVLPIPSQTVKQVDLYFVQSSKYLSTVGHTYYTETNANSLSDLQLEDEVEKYTRINGTNPSVSLLGCKYNPETQWITYDRDNAITDKYIKQSLFALPQGNIDVKVNQEIIEAYRYVIAIRDIKLFSAEYQPYGEYISNAFTTNAPITSISLESTEYIPGDNAEIVQYHISLDGGLNWYKIYPSHRAYQGIYRYYVNNDTIENLLSTNKENKKSKNIATLGNCNSVQLKITMDAPSVDNALYSTPIVYEYKLKITTGGETIEY